MIASLSQFNLLYEMLGRLTLIVKHMYIKINNPIEKKMRGNYNESDCI